MILTVGTVTKVEAVPMTLYQTILQRWRLLCFQKMTALTKMEITLTTAIIIPIITIHHINITILKLCQKLRQPCHQKMTVPMEKVAVVTPNITNVTCITNIIMIIIITNTVTMMTCPYVLARVILRVLIVTTTPMIGLILSLRFRLRCLHEIQRHRQPHLLGLPKHYTQPPILDTQKTARTIRYQEPLYMKLVIYFIINCSTVTLLHHRALCLQGHHQYHMSHMQKSSGAVLHHPVAVPVHEDYELDDGLTPEAAAWAAQYRRNSLQMPAATNINTVDSIHSWRVRRFFM